MVGVLQTYDFTGLDVYYRILSETPIASGSHVQAPPEIVKRKVDAGHLGVKSGKGLYDYCGRTEREIMRTRDLRYIEILKLFSTNRKPL